MKRTLPKPEIVRGYRAFSKIIANGKRISVPPVRAFVLQNPAATGTVRAGFSVSKGANAAQRNRLKRYLREAYRLNKHLIAQPPAGGLEVVFLHARPTTESRVTFAATEMALKTILSKLNTASKG